MADKKTDIGSLLSGAGGYTGIGAELAPYTGGISLPVGVAADVGTQIAGYLGEAEKERRRREERREDIIVARGPLMQEQQKIMREEARRKRLREALRRYTGGA